MVAVRLENITKSFGNVTAVAGVSLDVAEGELFFLLGPSGCGKTTLLRTIAGFEAPEAGRVYFDGSDITSLPPHKRNTGMVFQNYALWPHMSVFENVAYGLRVRAISGKPLAARVNEALGMVRMGQMGGRFPNQLSGGQQQRVALARALVIKPDCLLLDEPLSNLDAKLRLEMRDEIRRIHRETAVTTIYVTHDQKEALSMAGRLAIISEGRIVQTGAPEDVYRQPANAFVAAFVGETNLIEGTLAHLDEDHVTVRTRIGEIRGMRSASLKGEVGRACLVSIRPEDIRPAESPGRVNSYAAEVAQFTFLGETGQYIFKVGALRIKAVVAAPSSGEPISHLTFPPELVLVFPAAGEPGGGDAP